MLIDRDGKAYCATETEKGADKSAPFS